MVSVLNMLLVGNQRRRIFLNLNQYKLLFCIAQNFLKYDRNKIWLKFLGCRTTQKFDRTDESLHCLWFRCLASISYWQLQTNKIDFLVRLWSSIWWSRFMTFLGMLKFLVLMKVYHLILIFAQNTFNNEWRSNLWY